VFPGRELWIDADVRQLRDARDWAATAAADFGLAHEDCYQVKLAISETVANAIQHGSSGQGDPIRISVQARADALVFDVWDTGVFDRGGEPAEELAERGRGLEIVAAMMDEMELTPGEHGTRLRFSKRRNGRPTDR
jgi:anti-sigma regulatory factor (Ser/Thr protein kinase)